ncbi:Uncharacterised protein [Mycobacterium tuberculosis]|nr:Uncharacterised protein [Mycobacterium tuberculosis]
MLEHHADALPHLVQLHALVGEVHAVDDDVPRRGLLELVQAAQQRRLARAGGADHGDDLTVLDREVDALEHLVVAERLVQVPDLDLAHALAFLSRRFASSVSSVITTK